MERHEAGDAVVIPVIVDPCDWEAAPFSKLQTATKDGKPISKYTNKHDAYLEITKAVRTAVSSRRKKAVMPPPSQPSAPEPKIVPEVRSSNLRLKKSFTDEERDKFREGSFEYMANYFEASLGELQSRNPGVTGTVKRITSTHFKATIYREGKTVAQCGVRIGGSFMGNQIVYSQAPDSTNSWNESLAIEDDGYSLFLKATMGAFQRREATERDPLTRGRRPNCIGQCS